MIDTELIALQLRAAGYTVGHITPVPSNAGTYEFQVDGRLLSLEDTRILLESGTFPPESA